MPLLPRPPGETFVSWYNTGVFILWPPMNVATKHEWRGAEHIGSYGDGLVLGVNHISWFDPFAVAHFVNDNGRSVRFLAKAALFDVPVGNRVLKGTDQIPVYRASGDAAAAVDAAVQAVDDGECIIVYPEGTITRDPDLWPMTAKTGAARIALTTRKPLVPVAQWGAHEVMAPYKVEANLIPRKTMRFLAGEPVDLSDLYDLELSGEVLAVATNRLMDAITGLLAELRGEEPPEGRWSMKAEQREPRGPTSLPELP